MLNNVSRDKFRSAFIFFIKFSNEYTIINPKQEVPALFIDGKLLLQSVQIALYLSFVFC